MYGNDTITDQISVNPLEWFYTVTITNQTTETFDIFQAFYASTRLPNAVVSANTEGPVAPGETVILRLGVCAEMVSYVVGLVLNGAVVWSIPDPDGWNPDGSIILKHHISWQDGLAKDGQRCEDSYIISPSS